MNYSKKYDVAVVGGGIAGIAAALASARVGKKTVLLEKTVLPGGLATTGLVYIYLPLCDGNGRQITFGICEELIKLSLKYGPGDIPVDWDKRKDAPEAQRYRCIFSPASFILALDEVLQEAGVEIWLDTLVCDALVDGEKRLTSVVVENESGRGTIGADCFIDASGSGLVARRAGAAFSDETNYLSVWALEYNREPNAYGELSREVTMHYGGSTASGAVNVPTQRGISGRKVTDFVLAGRGILREHYRGKHDSGEADRSTLFPLKLPAMPQFRKIYAIDGMDTLDSDQHTMFFENSIGLVADWRKPGHVWEIPYGVLVPKTIKGLLTAGRCISSVGDAWDVTRAIPAVALTGEAAGIAAAMAVGRGITPDKLNVAELQTTLKTAGHPLHLQDVGLPYRHANHVVSA